VRVRQTPRGGRPRRWRGHDGGDPPERWSPEDHARRGHGPRTDLRFDELPDTAPPVADAARDVPSRVPDVAPADELRDEPSRLEPEEDLARGESLLVEDAPATEPAAEALAGQSSGEPARDDVPVGEPGPDDRIERYERRFREEEAQRRAWRDLARRSEPPPAGLDRPAPVEARPREEEIGDESPARSAARRHAPTAAREEARGDRHVAARGERRARRVSLGRRRRLASEAASRATAATAPRTEHATLRSRLGLLAYLSFLVFGLAVLPRAIGDLTQRGELPEARLTRDRIGYRLTSLRDRFLLLADDVAEQRRRVEKIRIAYGLAVSMEPLPATPVDPKAFPATVYRPLIEETAKVATMARIEVVDLEAKVAALRTFEAARPEVVAFTPALSPLRGEFVLTSLFGYRKSAFTEAQEYHSGVDLGAPVGTPVLAPADGTVLYVGKFPVARESTWWRLGQVVALRHGDELLSIYGHVDRLRVRRGQTVARGDVLAEIGESGVSANPHLHYAVWRRRPTYDARDRPQGEFEPIDPRLLMLDRQWDDEDELLANAGAGPARSEYEPLPRALR
jgi:murein DD-endopeptidase MepM/ murein hydrolase activator NlpD